MLFAAKTHVKPEDWNICINPLATILQISELEFFWILIFADKATHVRYIFTWVKENAHTHGCCYVPRQFGVLSLSQADFLFAGRDGRIHQCLDWEAHFICGKDVHCWKDLCGVFGSIYNSANVCLCINTLVYKVCWGIWSLLDPSVHTFKHIAPVTSASLHKAALVLFFYSCICMTEPAVCALIYECNIMRFNNVALGFMTFYESVCVYVRLSEVTLLAIHCQTPFTSFQARIELDVSEMTMKLSECDRKRREREHQFFLLQQRRRLTVILFWKSESDRFGISSVAREWGALVP